MAKKKDNGFIAGLSALIVDKRKIIYVLYVFAILFSVFSMNWTVVENDVTTYLSEETETRQGIIAMNENFVEFGSARIMVSNITLDTAYDIHEMISEVDGVEMVTFNDTEDG